MGTDATANILEKIVDVDDALLSATVASQIGSQAQALLGDSTFELPELGVPLVPIDAVAEPGGRYVRISLAP